MTKKRDYQLVAVSRLNKFENLATANAIYRLRLP